jgi:uncharacterized membrane protein YbhN (UPF0104 family)
VANWADELLHRFAGVELRLVLIALVFHVANHLLRSVAWRNLLAAAYPDRRVALLPVASAYALGVALNAITPARGGDAAKLGLARAAIPESSVVTIAGTMSVLVLFDTLAGTLLVAAVALGGVVPIAVDLPALSPLPVAAVVAAAAALTWLARRRASALWAKARQGGAILATPWRYARRVALPQTLAWACRIAVIVCLLAAFGLPASIPLAGLVMVLAGASTIVPLTPGGAGTQQVLLAYALSSAASAAAIVSFSIGMQLAVTLVNALLGLAAAMVVCGTAHPVAAVRRGLQLARA